MPNELKIVIDADIQKGVAGIKEFSKVVSGEFNKAIGSVSSLEKSITDSISKINSSLSGLKVTSLDVSVNTSQIDAGIKSIQSKFATLVDPKIDILANSTQAEATIKDLIADISALKGSEIFIRANDTQALKVINEVENELKGILDKQISLRIDSKGVAEVSKVISGDFVKATQAASSGVFDLEKSVAQATSRINASVDKMVADALGGAAQLKSSFGDFGKVNIDSSQVTTAIEQLKAKLATLQAKVPITVTAEGLEKLNADIAKTKADLNSLVSKNIKVDVDATAALQKVTALKGDLAAISNVPFKFNTQPAIQALSGLQNQVRGLNNSLKTVSGLNSFQSALGKSTQAVKNLQATGSGLNSFYSNLVTQNNRAVTALQKLPKAADTSSQALINFGRVIQDAPFGILGIANNLNPLIESMQRASAAAKATGTSLSKNLLGALTGPVGIGIGVSVVSSLLLAFGDDIANLVTGSSKLDKALDEAAGSIDKNAASVITMVKALQSGTLTSEQFKKVKAELIAQAPEFQKSFDGDKISIEASDKALSAYITKLTTTVRVTAALGIVNDTLAKSIRAIAKGEDFSFGEAFSSFFESGLSSFGALEKTAEKSSKNIQKAIDSLKPENVSKLLEDTFKKLGITFNDFADTFDGKSLDAALAKQKAAFEKFQNETIASAKEFKKEFGESFVLPELEESFFVSKDQVFKNALKVLKDVKADLSKQTTIDELQLKLPILFTTETRLDDSDLKKFLRGEITRDQVREIKIRVPVVTDLDIQVSESVLAGSLAKELDVSKRIIDNFFQDVKLLNSIDISVVPEFSIPASATKQFDKLEEQFAKLGERGKEAFAAISFGTKDGTNQLQAFNDGLKKAEEELKKLTSQASRKLSFEFEVEFAQRDTGKKDAAGNAILEDISNSAKEAALTINEALTPAFQNMFDAILSGKSPIKAFFDSIIKSIEQVIKRLIAAAVQAAILSAITGGTAGSFGSIFKNILGVGTGGRANLGFGGIGSSSFSNVLRVEGVTRTSGNDIVTSWSRTTNTNGRYG